MPRVTLPVPSHSGHGPRSTRPLPPQRGQTVSPVPGVPRGASSPGLIPGGVVGLLGLGLSLMVGLRTLAATRVPTVALPEAGLWWTPWGPGGTPAGPQRAVHHQPA
jgi:hypothetical protein